MSTSSKVTVSNLSKDSTEESVQDYFSFCGDIKSVSVALSDDDRSKEAVIVFESSAAASTAVLLNNALVEGRNISVELVDDGAQQRSPTTSTAPSVSKGDYGGSTASINSKGSQVLSELTSQAKSVASQVSSATKELNNKYDITGKIKGAYDSAAVSTSAAFVNLDTQYDLSGKSAKAVEATKAGFSSMYRQISGFWGNGNTTANTSSNTNGSNSPPNSDNPSF